MLKLLMTQRKALAYLLLFSFIGWVNATTFPVLAQDQNPGAQAQKPIAASHDLQAVKPDAFKAENPETNTQVVEKTESAKPKVKKRYFPWLGVLLSLAVAGGLVYYFFILKTTLQVNTTPAGAIVYLDGTATAKVTPCELKPAIGSHTIKVVLEGYADVEREVVIKNGKNSLTIPLEIGNYMLTTPPNNANVQREAPCLINWKANTIALAVSSASKQPQGVTKVDLELFQGDAKVSDIARGVPNSGSYTWNVPATMSEGYNFKIQVSCPGVAASRAFGPAFNLLGFKEDFTDNAADFWLPDNTASWKVADGYFTASKTIEKFGMGIYDFFYSESSYTVESRMRWSEFNGTDSGAPIFIMLGISASFTNNSGYVLGYSMDGTVSIYQVDGYNFIDPAPDPLTILYSGSSTAINTGLNNWNTVKVVRSGSSYTLYINDTMVCTFTNSTYNPNYIMLGFGSAGIKTTCDFDYVYMTVNH